MHVNTSLIGKKNDRLWLCDLSQLALDWSLVLGCMRNKSLSFQALVPWLPLVDHTWCLQDQCCFSVSTFVCLWLPPVVAIDWIWFALLSVPSDMFL